MCIGARGEGGDISNALGYLSRITVFVEQLPLLSKQIAHRHRHRYKHSYTHTIRFRE
jgi:hypothetical protein